MRQFFTAMLLVGWLFGSGDSSQAAEKVGPFDPLAKHFVPPELILQNRDRLDASDEQISTIEAEVQATQKAMPGLQKQLKAELKALGELLEAGEAAESTVLEQLNKVLDQEREVKQLHLRLLLRIRAQLTDVQREIAQEIKTELQAEGQELRKRIQAKMRRLQTIMQQRAGRQPPAAVVELVKSFEELIKNDRPRAAETLLDKAIEQLGEEQ